ncbi:MAG: hypothetical protein ACT4PT_00440 [Methanobacteriota archaeon]
MVAEFQNVKKEIVRFNNAAYLTVERNRVVEDNKASEYLTITRGYYMRDGTARRRSQVTLPNDPATIQRVAELLKTI